MSLSSVETVHICLCLFSPKVLCLSHEVPQLPAFSEFKQHICVQKGSDTSFFLLKKTHCN